MTVRVNAVLPLIAAADVEFYKPLVLPRGLQPGGFQPLALGLCPRCTKPEHKPMAKRKPRKKAAANAKVKALGNAVNLGEAGWCATAVLERRTGPSCRTATRIAAAVPHRRIGGMVEKCALETGQKPLNWGRRTTCAHGLRFLEKFMKKTSWAPSVIAQRLTGRPQWHSGGATAGLPPVSEENTAKRSAWRFV